MASLLSRIFSSPCYVVHDIVDDVLITTYNITAIYSSYSKYGKNVPLLEELLSINNILWDINLIENSSKRYKTEDGVKAIFLSRKQAQLFIEKYLCRVATNRTKAEFEVIEIKSYI